MLRMLVPGMALGVDPLRGYVHLMTRSGRLIDGRPQRAILRLDDRLRFLEGFTLDVPAGRMVYLARREIALVIDDEDRFHACPLRSATAATPGP
ncbi:MAG: hypothetical protein GWN71_39500 [Gammaproteobacteria bacterium]|nr:hypothetical protein [Gammaproteobacteria bacterium]